MRLDEDPWKFSRVAALGLVAALSSGCRSMPQNGNIPPAVGVAYHTVIPPGAPRYHLKSGEAVQMPVLEEKVIPEFPPMLITSEDRSVQILAHLVINEFGSVDRANFEASIDDYELEPFRASIRKAVMAWKFSPMVIIRTVSDGRDSKIKRERTAKPVSLWYQFQFMITNGHPATTIKQHSPS